MTQVDEDRWELAPDDELYPPQLLATSRPPRRLFVIGDPTALTLGLAVVGSRKATPYGEWAARRFAGWAAMRGVTVVSGAAHGCDRCAQEAAVAAGGATVAVLGCGADVDYPRASGPLLGRLRRECAVVSEAPWGTQPKRWLLRNRNRIIAGLSKAVLIVEAALPSGTFSTADFALDAGRDVLAVPGSIRSRESRGTNRLIRQGATPVTDVSELAQSLEDLGLLAGPDRAEGDAQARNAIDAGQMPGTTDLLARTLLADPMRPDDVAWELGWDIRDVMVRIARLERTGLVARYPDGRYGPAACVPPGGGR